MAKKNNIAEGKTLEQIKAELETVVDTHNNSENAAERNTLKVKAEKLKEAYNECSLHNAYAECLGAEKPMLAFIQMYKYPVVSVGSERNTGDMTLKTEDGNGNKLTEVFNLWHFVEYCEGRDTKVTAALDWKSKAKQAKVFMLDAINKYIDDGTEKDVKGMKDALDAMFDSVIMIAGAKGGNQVRSTSKQVREIYMTCGRMDAKSLNIKFGTEKSWQKQAFAYLYAAVEGKEFTIIYGDDDTKVSATEETATEQTAAK